MSKVRQQYGLCLAGTNTRSRRVLNPVSALHQMQLHLPRIQLNANSLCSLSVKYQFTVPLILLYFLNPGSFESMWKGRTFQLFFIWLVALEFILSWETIKLKIN